MSVSGYQAVGRQKVGLQAVGHGTVGRQTVGCRAVVRLTEDHHLDHRHCIHHIFRDVP